MSSYNERLFVILTFGGTTFKSAQGGARRRRCTKLVRVMTIRPNGVHVSATIHVGHAGLENNVIVTVTGPELLSRAPMLF